MNFIDIAHAQEAVATTAPADTGVLASLGINGTLFAEQLLNYAVIACVVWFLILKPLSKKLQERAKLIDDSIENAKRVENNLHKSEKEFQARIDAAKVEASKIVEKSATEAEQVSLAMKEKAKSEIEMLVVQAKRNIAIEKQEMMQDLREQTATLVVAVVEKVLAEKMTGEKDQQMIQDVLKKMN